MTTGAMDDERLHRLLDEELAPRMFSFNSLAGSCPTCLGVGQVRRCDPELLVNRPERPLLTGAMKNKPGEFFVRKSYFRKVIRTLAKEHGVDIGVAAAEIGVGLRRRGPGDRSAYADLTGQRLPVDHEGGLAGPLQFL